MISVSSLRTAAEVNVGRMRASPLISIGPFKDRDQARVVDGITIDIDIDMCPRGAK